MEDRNPTAYYNHRMVYERLREPDMAVLHFERFLASVTAEFSEATPKVTAKLELASHGKRARR